jgi:zinc transport system ATP-binding protein
LNAAQYTLEPRFALRLTDVSVSLGGRAILERVTFEPAVGHLNAIIGPNGAGKTTLLRAILGLLPYSGRIEWGSSEAGKPLRAGYVPQRLDFDRGIPMTVLDFMCAGLQQTPVWLGHSARSRRLTHACLERVGGTGWEKKPLGRLSGGELQRVLLAMALSNDPDILLLDEPVSGADVAGEQLFCDLLGSLQETRQYTMLLVSHDLSIVTRHAQYVVCLNKTVKCCGRTVETLTAENLKVLYEHDVGLYAHTGTHEGHAHEHRHHDAGPGISSGAPSDDHAHDDEGPGR